MTKEELIQKVAKLETELEIKTKELEKEIQSTYTRENNIKKEFAKAFNWRKPKDIWGGRYDQESDYQTPSWEQIFVEIGKLKAVKDFRNFENTIQSLSQELNELRNQESPEL